MSLSGLEGYNCILWKINGDEKGSFDESGYEIDHIVEFCKSKNDKEENLQALCIACHKVKTKRFLMSESSESPKNNNYNNKKINNNNILIKSVNYHEHKLIFSKNNYYRCEICGIDTNDIWNCCECNFNVCSKCSDRTDISLNFFVFLKSLTCKKLRQICLINNISTFGVKQKLINKLLELKQNDIQKQINDNKHMKYYFKCWNSFDNYILTIIYSVNGYKTADIKKYNYYEKFDNEFYE